MLTPSLSVVFWAALGLLAWTWAGYPGALMIAGGLAARRPAAPGRPGGPGEPEDAEPPGITMIIPVFNADRALTAKLRNCLALRYPGGQVEILVLSDGSTDRSAPIALRFAAQHPQVRLIESGGRVGKSAAQNLAASLARGDILLLTDVDTMLGLDALQVVARSFRHPEVGCVTGHVVWGAAQNVERARADNLYWRFEHAIWRHETALGIMACASGPCMAVRARLFRDIDPRYGDDVVLPLDVIRQGFRVAYEPSLLALERSAERPGEALRARTRMTLRSLRGTLSRRSVFSPVGRPMLCAAVLSHKLLRWATPFLFLALLGAAVPLAVGGQAVPTVVMALQGAALAVTLAGHLAYRRDLRIPVVAVVYGFALDNLGILIGVTRALLGRAIVTFR